MLRPASAQEHGLFIALLKEWAKGRRTGMQVVKDIVGLEIGEERNVWLLLDKGTKHLVADQTSPSEFSIDKKWEVKMQQTPKCAKCKVFVFGNDGFLINNVRHCNHCIGDYLRDSLPIDEVFSLESLLIPRESPE